MNDKRINAMKLAKAERLKFIEAAATLMSEYEYSKIDFILSQYGFPIEIIWDGSKEEYLQSMIGSGNDALVVELAQYFGIAPVADSVFLEAAATLWEEGKLRVFISHLTSHRVQAGSLKASLSGLGMSGFVAHDDINPTVEWQTCIESALASCDLLVALIHPSFHESRWCDQEIGFALGRGIPVFSVRCGADPHGFVSRFQAFNGNGKSEAVLAAELFAGARGHKQLQQKMADIVMNLFVASGTYATAKQRIAYLEGLTTWDSTYTERLKKATAENPQIKGAWGVPDQVQALIKKWEGAK
jgi:hypothetical protein